MIGPPIGAAETVVVVARIREAVEVVLPGVGVQVVVEVVLVCRAVPLVGAALGDDLHLRARGTVEVGALAGDVHLELFHAVGRGRHDAGRAGCHAVALVGDAAGRITGVAGRVHAHAAVHVVGVLAAVELERALVDHRAGHAAVRADARLQRQEGAGVARDAG